MDRKDKISIALDFLDDVKGYYDENREDIRELLGMGNVVMEIEDREMLGELHIDKNSITIVAEVDDIGDKDKITIEKKGNRLSIMAGEQKLEEQIPDNINMDSIETTLKNDVLTVTIDREVE